MTGLLKKHMHTIECECLLGEHTGESDKSLEEAITLAEVQVDMCQEAARMSARLMARMEAVRG